MRLGPRSFTAPSEHSAHAARPVRLGLVWRQGAVTELGGQAPELPALATYDMNGADEVTRLLSDGVRVAQAAVRTASGYPGTYPPVVVTQLSMPSSRPSTRVGRTLTYDPGTGRHQDGWKTHKAWARTCRAFTMELADGWMHAAEFRFR